jgi:outer membrane lipoprotein-sorting protein
MARVFRLFPVLFAFVLSTAGLVYAQAQAAAPASPTVDEIVAKNIKAKGGADKIKSMQTMQMSGTATLQGMDVSMKIYSKRPNMTRQEVKLQEKTIVSGYDGTTAWWINPMMGIDTAQELSGPQAESLKDQADFDGVLNDYKAKGHTVELVGTEEIDGKKAYHLKVTKKNGQVQHYFLDADSGIDLRVQTTVEQGGQQMNITSDLSNYQPVSGVMVPFSMKQSMNGMPLMTMTINKVEFNVPIDDALFKMPGK